ncbi:hypothetical protein [Dokdonella sp.]|uniref:hypothetical protein n=1 Tax=Dokdonella sp. TaxID=2291710 RepID=UPI003528AE1F
MKISASKMSRASEIRHELSNVEMNYSANQRGELLLGQALVTRTSSVDWTLLQASGPRRFAEQPTTAANELALEVELGNDLFALGNHEQGIAHTRRCVEIADQLYPRSTRYRARTNNLGSMLRVDDQLGTAEAALAVAESIYREPRDERSAAFAALLHNRGLLLHDTGNSARSSASG